MYQKTTFERGFTLVEVSIVLAVLGLLVGTVIGARVFMRNQERNRVLTDARAYSVAYDQFKLKYNAIPGDMVNATEIWGRADGLAPITSNCDYPYSAAAKSKGLPTCNGNGNGLIDEWMGFASTVYENWRTWQHIYAAGFIAGTFSGVGAGGSCSTCNLPGYNVPKGAISGTGYAFTRTFTGFNYFYGPLNTTEYYNIIIFGAMTGSTTADPWSQALGALTAEEAYNIDTKADDGMPGLGMIQTMVPSVRANCATGVPASYLTATYDTTNQVAGCVLLFLDGFANKR